MPPWIPQNIQKRLLRYVLTQLSVFSEIDLSDLDVSLGNVALRNVLLNPEAFKIPGFFLRSGQIGLLNLLLATDGVAIKASEVEIIVVATILNQTPSEFSLARSRADLASSVMPLSEEPGPEQSGPAFYQSYVTRAVEMALSRLLVSVSGILVKVILDETLVKDWGFYLNVNSASWTYESEKAKNVVVEGVGLFTETVSSEKKTPKQEKLFKSPLKKAKRSSNLAVLEEEDVEESNDSSPSFPSSPSPHSRSSLSSEDNPMMASSFLPDRNGGTESDDELASAMFMSANSHLLTTQMTMSKLREDKSAKSTLMASEKDRLFESIYETATGESKTSELGHSFSNEKTVKPSVAPANEHRRYIAYVTEASLKFAGLVNIEDVELRIESLRVSLCESLPDSSYASLLDILLCAAKRQDRVLRVNVQHSSPRGVRANSSTEASDSSGGIQYFSKLFVGSFEVNMDAVLNERGEWGNDGLVFRALGTHVTRKSTELIFGGITTVEIEENNKKAFFLSPESLDDVRFECLIKDNVKSTTALISKVITVRITSSLIKKVALKVTKLNLIIDTFSRAQATKNSPLAALLHMGSSLMFHAGLASLFVETGKAPESTFTFQSNSIHIYLPLDRSTLFFDVFPINYSSNPGSATIPKVLVYDIGAVKSLVGRIGRISLTQYSKSQHHQVHTYDAFCKEATYTTDAITDISGITISGDQAFLNRVSQELKKFVSSLNTHEPAPPRRVRMNTTVTFLSPSFMKMQIRISEVLFGMKLTAEVTEYTEDKKHKKPFGLLEGLLNDCYVNIFADGGVQLLLKRMNAVRFSGDVAGINVFAEGYKRKLFEESEGVQEILTMANPQDNVLPMFGVKSAGGCSKSFLRNTRIEYHALWFGESSSKKAALEEIPSISINNANPMDLKRKPSTSFPFKLRLVDCVLGLNPCRLAAKGLLVIDHGDVDIYTDEDVFVRSQLRDVGLMLIDDVANILSESETRKKRQWQARSSGDGSWSQVSWNRSRGFALVGSLGVLNILFTQNNKAKLAGMKGERAETDIKIDADGLKLELCADSAQLLGLLSTDLKAPIVLSDKQKFLASAPFAANFHLFDELDENAFKVTEDPETQFLSANSDIIDSEVSTNSEIQIVEDYYSKNHASPYESADSETLGGASNEGLAFEGDHWGKESESGQGSIIPFKIYVFVGKISILLFDGFDWPDTRKAIKKAVKEIEDRGRKAFKSGKDGSKDPDNELISDEELLQELIDGNAQDQDHILPLITKTLFDSVQISLPQGTDPAVLATSINRALGSEKKSAEVIPNAKTDFRRLRLRRSKEHRVRIEVSGLEIVCTVFTTEEPAYGKPLLDDPSVLLNSLNVRAEDLIIIDNIPESTWHTFMLYDRSYGARETGSSVLRLSLSTHRPASSLGATESVLRVAVLPLRLHVDQAAVEFFTRFGGFRDKRFLFDPIYDDVLYLSRALIDSVRVNLDYKPRKLDYVGLRSGNTSELMNLFVLDGARITLRSAVVRGVTIDRLGPVLDALWLPDIRTTQLPGVAAGLLPLLAALGGGFKTLVQVPVGAYKKDGRLTSGLQKGAVAFARTTGGELLRFGIKAAAGTQTLLENAEAALGGAGAAARQPVSSRTSESESRSRSSHRDRVSSPRSSRYGRYYTAFSESDLDDVLEGTDDDSDWDIEPRAVSLYADPPMNAKEGLTKAASSLERNLEIARAAFAGAGAEGASFGALARAAPVALLRPVIGTTEAILKTLMGVSSEVDPEQSARAREKYGGV